VQKADLVRMANQIALFFEPYGGEEAVAGVAGHLRNFWEPRMRSQLITIVETEPGLVHELVRAAVAQQKAPET
jgi:formate dehydrogenase subunit delta